MSRASTRVRGPILTSWTGSPALSNDAMVRRAYRRGLEASFQPGRIRAGYLLAGMAGGASPVSIVIRNAFRSEYENL
jgi:hypothetical protein